MKTLTQADFDQALSNPIREQVEFLFNFVNECDSRTLEAHKELIEKNMPQTLSLITRESINAVMEMVSKPDLVERLSDEEGKAHLRKIILDKVVAGLEA
jgi:hypothetical protein